MKIIATNKKAFHDYFILDEYEAGILLSGNEVKAIREGHINLRDCYVRVKKGEAHLVNCHISEYSKSSHIDTYDPVRLRKLLLHKREINKLIGKSQEKGLSIVPIEIYFNNRNIAKIKIAIVKGKKLFDKRDTIKKRDINREVEQELKTRN